MIRRLIGLLFIVGVLWTQVSIPLPAHAQDETTWFLTQINDLRASVGLYPYTLNAQLTAAATRQSQYLAETCNVVHTWPDGTTPADRALQAGYTGGWISENIYAGSNARPIDAWNFWLNSPIHYNGLVHDTLNEIGIGITHGGLCGHAYTLVFGLSSDGGGSPSGSGASGDSAGAAPAAAPQVYVPPPPTHTPTPTIPTLTPSATWTITPTFTATTTGAPPTATGTALVLPTVPAMKQRASATPTETPIPSDSPEPNETAVAVVDSPVPPTDTPQGVMMTPITPAADSTSGGFETRDLIPVALVVQIALIGAVGFWYFRRER